MDKKGKFVEYGIMLLVILCVIFIILGITLLMLSKVKEDIYEYSCFEDLANYHCNQINWVVKDMDLDNYTYNCMIACGHGLNKKSFSEWEIQNCSITTAIMSYASFMPSYEVLIFICVVFAFILISLKVIYEVNNSK